MPYHLLKKAIAVSGCAETGQDMVGGMPAGSPTTSILFPPPRRWSRMGKPILDERGIKVTGDEGAGVPLGIAATQNEMVDRLTRKWASDDFWRGFASIVKTSDFEVLRKLKARLESVRPVVTRSGQIRRIGINA